MFGSGQYTLKDKEAKPYIVWTIPEVAWVGLNEQEAPFEALTGRSLRWFTSRSLINLLVKEL